MFPYAITNCFGYWFLGLEITIDNNFQFHNIEKYIILSSTTLITNRKVTGQGGAVLSFFPLEISESEVTNSR